MINHWWVTRPKRKLNSVPEVLGAFAETALAETWEGQHDRQLSFEDALESSGIKRVGDRRDQGGGGARTYKAWLMSLGLMFIQEGSKRLQLTLAGEAIMDGKSPVEVLTNQVLKYQFPSSFSISRGVKVNERFRIHPFYFLLRLLLDKRLEFYLTEEEMAKIIICEADNESDKCYEKIVQRIIEFRNAGDTCLPDDFCQRYGSSRGKNTPELVLAKLHDVANTMKNWLEYTQLVIYDEMKLRIIADKIDTVKGITAGQPKFITDYQEHEKYQRRYGLDPWHSKDTRNLRDTRTVTSRMIEETLVKREFVNCSLKEPITHVTSELIARIAEKTGVEEKSVSEILQQKFPHGAIGAFMSSYFEMAFKGTEECRDFEKSTAAIFDTVFGFESKWLGSACSGKEVPDVLLMSDKAGFQAIIDTKAYNSYDLPATQRDRMIYHYLPDIGKYSDSKLPTAFFSYIAGGFSRTIATPLNKIVTATGVNGSAVTVDRFIKICERHAEKPYSHEQVREIFSVNRLVDLKDIE